MAKLLNVIPLAQSATLAADNVAFAKKKDKDVSDFMGQGVKNIVGASLIGETANIINF